MKATTVDFRKQYLEQLENFKNDNSSLEEYKYHKVKVKSEYVLIELFRAVFKDKSISTMLYLPDSLTGELIKSASNERKVVTNVCKVLVVGDNCPEDLKPGMLGTVQPDQVLGEVTNPAMELYLKSRETKGATPIPPEDTRVRIPKVEKNFGLYKFYRPWISDIEDKDRMTFIIPKYELPTWGFEVS